MGANSTKNSLHNQPPDSANLNSFFVMEGSVFALGNPLLDLIVKCDSQLLAKYQLKSDGAIEVDEWQMSLFDEILKYDVTYTPGGSAQNTCRVLQGILPGCPRSTTFVGCVGKDKNGEKLLEMVKKCGVNVIYMYDDTAPTGVSADLVHDQFRSLCANIGAAKCFNVSHLHKPQLVEAMTTARVLYVEGYFLTHSFDSAMHVAEFAINHNKIFAINLSANYICRDYYQQLSALIPFANLIFGNNEEAKTFCEVANLPVKNSHEMALKMSQFECKIPNTLKIFTDVQRCVIITRGPSPVVVADGNGTKEFPIPPLPQDRIVDTVGAGDAFVGGFLAQMIQEGELPDCVKSGIRAAITIVQKPGCSV